MTGCRSEATEPNRTEMENSGIRESKRASFFEFRSVITGADDDASRSYGALAARRMNERLGTNGTSGRLSQKSSIFWDVRTRIKRETKERDAVSRT